MSVPPQPEPGLATWKYLPGVDRRPLIEIPVLSQPNTFPAWCSETTAVIWSSTITTSSTKPLHWDANIPTVAEPQPTLILFSLTSLIIGGFPAWTIIFEPLSIVNSTASLLQRFIITSHVILPSILELPVKWSTPPSDIIWDPYSLVITWPTASPLYLTMSLSDPICRSVSTLIFTPQYENIASVTIVTKSISSIFLLNIKGAGL